MSTRAPADASSDDTPAKKIPFVPPRERTCPRCEAKPGDPCRSPTGASLDGPDGLTVHHTERLQANPSANGSPTASDATADPVPNAGDGTVPADAQHSPEPERGSSSAGPPTRRRRSDARKPRKPRAGQRGGGDEPAEPDQPHLF